ncbi:hypothetical protein DY262_20425 [Hydrogenophaga borbori]|uniref:Uncharacterized protein n=1 Tax=Hydrogenophaga borbori TaxID=2294117 RepID=A0A372EE83_9BURK|nr:hypothetical protein DY262_20425 [Hydrogenophaga borbori]
MTRRGYLLEVATQQLQVVHLQASALRQCQGELRAKRHRDLKAARIQLCAQRPTPVSAQAPGHVRERCAIQWDLELGVCG